MARIKGQGSYPNKPFKQQAKKLWDEFFKVADDTVDIAHSRIGPDSATVRLSARNSRVDESDPDLAPLEPSIVLIGGIINLLNECGSDVPAQKEISSEFRAWAEEGLLEAFQSSQIKKKFEKFNPDGKPFAIVTAETDCGLQEDELTVIWKNRRTFTVALIKSRQEAAKKKRKALGKRRGQVLRKKRGVTKKKATAKRKKVLKKKKSATKKKKKVIGKRATKKKARAEVKKAKPKKKQNIKKGKTKKKTTGRKVDK